MQQAPWDDIAMMRSRLKFHTCLMPIGNHQWEKRPEHSRINTTARKAKLHAQGEIDKPKGGENTALSGWLSHPPQQFPHHILHLPLHRRLYHQSRQGLGYVARVIGGHVTFYVELTQSQPHLCFFELYPHHPLHCDSDPAKLLLAGYGTVRIRQSHLDVTAILLPVTPGRPCCRTKSLSTLPPPPGPRAGWVGGG